MMPQTLISTAWKRVAKRLKHVLRNRQCYYTHGTRANCAESRSGLLDFFICLHDAPSFKKNKMGDMYLNVWRMRCTFDHASIPMENGQIPMNRVQQQASNKQIFKWSDMKTPRETQGPDQHLFEQCSNQVCWEQLSLQGFTESETRCIENTSYKHRASSQQ